MSGKWYMNTKKRRWLSKEKEQIYQCCIEGGQSYDLEIFTCGNRVLQRRNVILRTPKIPIYICMTVTCIHLQVLGICFRVSIQRYLSHAINKNITYERGSIARWRIDIYCNKRNDRHANSFLKVNITKSESLADWRQRHENANNLSHGRDDFQYLLVRAHSFNLDAKRIWDTQTKTQQLRVFFGHNEFKEFCVYFCFIRLK